MEAQLEGISVLKLLQKNACDRGYHPVHVARSDIYKIGLNPHIGVKTLAN